jgi:hypothetical protein
MLQDPYADAAIVVVNVRTDKENAGSTLVRGFVHSLSSEKKGRKGFSRSAQKVSRCLNPPTQKVSIVRSGDEFDIDFTVEGGVSPHVTAADEANSSDEWLGNKPRPRRHLDNKTVIQTSLSRKASE